MMHSERLLAALKANGWRRTGSTAHPQSWVWHSPEGTRSLMLRRPCGSDGSPRYNGGTVEPHPMADDLGRALGMTTEQACRWVTG